MGHIAARHDSSWWWVEKAKAPGLDHHEQTRRFAQLQTAVATHFSMTKVGLPIARDLDMSN